MLEWINDNSRAFIAYLFENPHGMGLTSAGLTVDEKSTIKAI